MKKTALVLALLIGAGGAALFSTPAFAAGTAKEKTLGTFGAWHAYAYDEGGQTVCYMVAMKTVASTGPKKRSLPYLMITHRPVEASTDVISYGAGAFLDAKRGVKLRVGANLFDLFSVRDTAWARDPLTDHKIAAALKSAPTAQISAISSQKGARIINDTFDLQGASGAYRAIGKACGLPDDAPKKSVVKKKTVKKPNAKKPPPPASQKTN